MKSLYFLHIPKTAGTYINNNIKKVLQDNNISCYFGTKQLPLIVDLNDYSYFSGHWGTYPIDKVRDLDVACVVRDPVDARISYYNMSYEYDIASRWEYSKYHSYLDKFKHYMFDDKNFLTHHNFQSRFICNSVNPSIFNESFKTDPVIKKELNDVRIGKAFSWFLSDDNTSFENAKTNLDNFNIVSTVDQIDYFLINISKWFEENYKIDLKFSQEKENVSITNFEDINYSTSYLRSLLSDDEIEQIRRLNSLDQAVYNYAKSLK